MRFLPMLALLACANPTAPARGCTLERALQAPLGWSITMREHHAVCPAPLGATTLDGYSVRWD